MKFFFGVVFVLAAIATGSYLLGCALENSTISGKTALFIFFAPGLAVITGVTLWSYVHNNKAWQRYFREHKREHISVMEDKSLWTNINQVYWWISILFTFTWVTIFISDKPLFFHVFSAFLFVTGLVIDIATRKVFKDEEDGTRQLNWYTIRNEALYTIYYLIIWFVLS